MAAKKDWLTITEMELLALIAVWQEKLSDISLRPLYNWPADECSATLILLFMYKNAAAKYADVPLKSNRIMRDEAKDDAKKGMRKFANERIRNNPAMTDGQKEEMGIRTRDTKPSPIPVPGCGPQSKAAIDPNAPGAVLIRYLGAKPYGVCFVEIAYAVSAAVIASPDQLTQFDTFSRNPWEKVFPAALRGQTLYYSLRYRTKKGASLWTEVRTAVIP